MNTYKVTCDTELSSLYVDGRTYGEAARKALHLLTTNHNTVALRVTGAAGKSGTFQGYTRGNPQSSIGPQFHIRAIVHHNPDINPEEM